MTLIYVCLESISPILPSAKHPLTKALKGNGIWVILVILMMSCQSGMQDVPVVAEGGTIEKPLYAKGFWFEKYQDYTILCLKPFQDAADTLRYGLYKRGSNSVPNFPQYIQPIAIPVKEVVALSATHIGMLDAIGAIDQVIGVSYPEYIYHEEVRGKVKDGAIVNVGMEGGLNKELLLSKSPDLLIATGMSAVSYRQDFGILTDAGIPVWPNAEWLEPTVLGRAEWMVALGALFDKKTVTQQHFQKIDSSYQALVKLTGEQVQARPKIIGGLPYKGAWSIAGGKSYVVKMLQDAGGDWPWANDTTSASLQMDFEAVYPIALEASYWLRVGLATNMEDLLGMDQRFADFPAVKNGKVYNYINRLAPNGMGNDYWESGVVKPHLILADLIKIIHPQLLPQHELYYYQQLPEKAVVKEELTK